MTTKKKTAKDDQAGIEDGALGELLDELEIRQRMAAITRRLPAERKRLYDATIAYRQKKYKTWLAICFLREDLLETPEGKSAVLNFKIAITEGKSKAPIEKDKEALIAMEMGDISLERELAEMAVEASESDFDMLTKQQMWYQSVMKNNGPYVPIENGVNATYNSYAQPLAAEPIPAAEPLAELPKIVIPDPICEPEPAGKVLPYAAKAARTEDEKADLPIARGLDDLITAKQLGMIRAICRELNVDPDEECMDFLSCTTDEVSKAAASAFITHLQQMQEEKKGSSKVSVASVYGGQKSLSDIRALDPDVKPKSEPPPNQYIEPDGTKTDSPDSDVPF